MAKPSSIRPIDPGANPKARAAEQEFVELANQMQQMGLEHDVVSSALASAAGSLAHFSVTEAYANPLEEWQIDLVQEHVARRMRDCERERRATGTAGSAAE